MRAPDIIVTSAPDEAAKAVIEAGLADYNERMAGYLDHQPLSVLARDPETGDVLGGAVGRSSLGLLFLDLFHLPESLRGQGIGSMILAAFEAEGRKRGCRSALLYTISFQAPDFYARYGWHRFGEIPCDPPGTSRIFMTKSL